MIDCFFLGGVGQDSTIGLIITSISPPPTAYIPLAHNSPANGGMTDGTYVASPMGAAATDDPEQEYRLGLVAAREGAAAGINWTFEPIIDIDRNPENPITNVRTFGSDPDRIIRMAKAYMDACREHKIATTIKHFPGDGVDFRDQHLMASVNSPATKMGCCQKPRAPLLTSCR